MPKPTFKTTVAKKEIELILKNHNLIGFVILTDGAGGGEVLNHLSPDWSCADLIYDDNDDSVQIGMDTKLFDDEGNKLESNLMSVQRTMNALVDISKGANIFGQCYERTLKHLLEHLSDYPGVELKKMSE